jgi:hypothetical protein
MATGPRALRGRPAEVGQLSGDGDEFTITSGVIKGRLAPSAIEIDRRSTCVTGLSRRAPTAKRDERGKRKVNRSYA